MSDAVELCAALIENACVNDGSVQSGQEIRSVRTIQEFLGDEGRVFEPNPGRASVVYRAEGSDPDARSLLLMGHLDVVPVSPGGWSRDPFSADIVDGVLWGRGAVDMLYQTAAMVVAFRDVASQARGDVVLAAVADEEAGGVHGVEHILATAPDALEADGVITEIGLPQLAAPDAPSLVVTVGEKGPEWTRLRARGTPGHASQPYRADSAVGPVAEAAARLTGVETPAEITQEWRAFVAALGLDEALTQRLTDPDQLDAAIDDLAVSDPGLARWAHACTHMTVAPTMLAGGTKANVIADAASADVDVRVLPGQDRAAVHDVFRKALGPALFESLELEPVLSHAATVSPASGPLWDSMSAAYARLAPGGALTPTLIPVSTDARFFRSQGVPAYGAAVFDERFGFSEVLAMYHGHDERVGVETIERTTEFYKSVVDELG